MTMFSLQPFQEKFYVFINLPLPHSNFHIFSRQGHIIVHLQPNHTDSMQAGFFFNLPSRVFLPFGLYQMNTADSMSS